MTKIAAPGVRQAENTTVDLLVIGSGTGMAAALAANELGLRTLVVEKTGFVGGSTARSGGAFWIPANPALLKAGSNDTLERGGEYLEAVVGDTARRALAKVPRERTRRSEDAAAHHPDEVPVGPWLLGLPPGAPWRVGRRA